MLYIAADGTKLVEFTCTKLPTKRKKENKLIISFGTGSWVYPNPKDHVKEGQSGFIVIDDKGAVLDENCFPILIIK